MRNYVAAAAVLLAGVALAVVHYPGGFDWVYTVVSRLASRRHNPTGGVWLSASLLAAAVLLWPVVDYIARAHRGADGRVHAAAVALRGGVIGAALLALEGLLAVDLSRIARKGHELLALATFAGMYGGIIGLSVLRVRRRSGSAWPATLALLPLCAVGLSQLLLYVGQRELGWVNTGWREMGIPFWLSFAFWQWLAVGSLGLAMGALLVQDRSGTDDRVQSHLTDASAPHTIRQFPTRNARTLR